MLIAMSIYFKCSIILKSKARCSSFDSVPSEKELLYVISVRQRFGSNLDPIVGFVVILSQGSIILSENEERKNRKKIKIKMKNK